MGGIIEIKKNIMDNSFTISTGVPAISSNPKISAIIVIMKKVISNSENLTNHKFKQIISLLMA